MTPRDVYLSPFDLGALWGTEQSLRSSNEPHSQGTDLFRLLCVTLMQAGADRFSMPGGNPPAFTTSEFLLKRISNADHPAADRSCAHIQGLYDHFLKDKPDSTPGHRDAQRLKYLICDIVRAMESGSSIALIAPLPDIYKASQALPPELIFPPKTLLNGLTTDMSVVPIPKVRVDKRDVAVLSELFQSDAYANYRAAHQQLERADTPTIQALRLVAAGASAIQKVARKHIHLGERIVSFLPATAKLVDELAGKAPSLVAEVLADLLSKWMTSRSRLVVYRFDSILTELLAQRANMHAQREP